MEISGTSFTPLVLATGFLFVFIVLQTVVNIRDLTRARLLQREMRALAIKHSKQTVSVLVELTTSVISILPLLDHLYRHHYNKLEVVVIVDGAASRDSRAQLINYQRANHINNLRIIRRTKNMKLRDVVNRYTSGLLIMAVKKSQRLSANFFNVASIEATHLGIDSVIMPRHQLVLGNTVTSALQVNANLLQQLGSNIFGTKKSMWPFCSGVLYSRQSILSGSLGYDKVRIAVSQQLCVFEFLDAVPFGVYLKQELTKARHLLSTPAGIGLFVGIIAVLLVLFIPLDSSDRLIFASFIIFAYTLVSITAQLRSNGYSAFDNFNLALTAPFGLLFLVVVYILGLFKLAANLIISRFKKKK